MMFKTDFSHFSQFILYHIPQLACLVVFILLFQFEKTLTYMTTLLGVVSLEGMSPDMSLVFFSCR